MTIEDLIAVALEFRAVKLWEVLDDSMIFAVRLPDGETGYCCVMGQAGQHYAMGVYIGTEGLSTYLKSVSGLAGSNTFEVFLTYDCMNCDYENATESGLTSAQKKQIRAVAAERNIKICRPKGFPEFIRYERGIIRTELNEKEMTRLYAALKAGLEVASKVKGGSKAELIRMGFDEDRGYISINGGDKLPMLSIQPNGSFDWSETVLPKIDMKSGESPRYDNPSLISQLRKMERKGSFQCKVVPVATPIKCEGGVYYPNIIVLMTEDGMACPVMGAAEDPHDATASLLDQLTESFISMDVYPKALMVDDDYSQTFLSEYCKHTNIKLLRTSYMADLNQLADMLNSQLGMF